MIVLFGTPVPLSWVVGAGVVAGAALVLLVVLLVRSLGRGGAPAEVVAPAESSRRVERPALEVRPRHAATAGPVHDLSRGSEPRHSSSAIPALAMLDDMATVPLPRPARDTDSNPSTDPLAALTGTAPAEAESRSSPRHAR